VTSNCAYRREMKGPSMSFKQACRAALGAGVLVWVLPVTVLAQGPQHVTVAFTNVNVIPLAARGNSRSQRAKPP
jgi:hypothetical protein